MRRCQVAPGPHRWTCCCGFTACLSVASKHTCRKHRFLTSQGRRLAGQTHAGPCKFLARACGLDLSKASTHSFSTHLERHERPSSESKAKGLLLIFITCYSRSHARRTCSSKPDFARALHETWRACQRHHFVRMRAPIQHLKLSTIQRK